MSSRAIAMTVLVAALTLAVGCPAPIPLGDLDEDDDGTNVILPVSAKFTVALSSNPTTGYAWEVAERDAATLENTDQRYVPDPASEGLVGGGGTDVWEFTAGAVGDSTLRLVYHRPWETVEPAESFELAVSVREADPDSGIPLGADDEGALVLIPISERFTVELASNASTGYAWQLAEIDASILENTDQVYVGPEGDPMPGTGGHELWQFTGRASGVTTLRLTYLQPWRSEEDEEWDSFEVSVTVLAGE
jgi:inhibitor of cysteine peptidase